MSNNDLEVKITKYLDTIEEETTRNVKEVIEENAQILKKQIAHDSPKRSGKYAKGWKCKKAYESATDVRYTINNPKHDPLIHLLEFGHASRNGGRVRPYPHVLDNYESIKKKMERELNNKL